MTIEETINGLQSMIQSKKFIEHDFDGVVDEDVCERAIELLKENEDLGTELTNAVELIHKKNERIKKLLKEQEAVDKNTGEWKNGHCSCCGEDVASKLDTWTDVQSFLFCPNCGAKMEE